MILEIVCIYMFALWIFMFFGCKRRFSVMTYMFWGVYFPLFLYQLNWSGLIDDSNSGMFNYIFIAIAILFTFYCLATYKKSQIAQLQGQIVVTRFGRQLALPLNLIYLALYLVENYMGSGSLIPGLMGIDIHTYSAPIVSYITNAQFLILAFDYYYFKATKKKKYFIFMGLIVLVPVVTRLARMTIVMSLVQIGSLILFCEMKTIRNRLYNKKTSKRIKWALVIIGICGFVGLSVFTQYRMELHNANFTYQAGILYQGPEWLGWIAPYYGYFPLSFNNLKINILYRTVNHNYIGLYSFASLFFGVLQLDNLLGINVNGFLKGRIITSGLATVPTAFWEYYYDFGVLFFIPIIIALLICYRFERKAIRETNRLTYHTLYFWYVSYWFFTSFQNTMFLSPSIIVGLMMLYIIKHSFRVVNEDHS